MNFNKTLCYGILTGALATLGVVILLQVAAPSRHAHVLAEVGGERLTRQDLRQQLSSDLVPIENDEYRILSQGVEQWIDERLIQKEAKAQGATVEELYRKEIWNQVQVSYTDALETYHKTRELYSEPFEKVSASILQELRRSRYAALKDEFLGKLKEKYHARNFLKKPDSYVEGLALPVAPNLVGGAPFVPLGAGKAGDENYAPPTKGPAGSKITITEFADFQCGFCKRVQPTLKEIMKNYPAQVRFVFRHYPLSTTPGTGSFLVHEGTACAHEQGKFWSFYDEAFGFAGTPGENDLQDIAQKVGLDSKQFDACLKSGKTRDQILSDRAEGEKKGVSGTPTFFVNEQIVGGAYPYDHFQKIIEGILDPSKAVPEPPPPPAPPAVATFDDLEGRPAQGPKNAPVTLVEFSEFQCPFCKKVTPTVEQLMKNYPEKIRRIWRHYPLSFHKEAEPMALASECAHEQGKFWEYHDKLFETQGTPHDQTVLVDLAGQIGLDKKKFEQCLTSQKYKAQVQKDQAKGNSVGVSGTPAVFLNGKLISGAQPYQNFDQRMKAALEALKKD